MSKQDKSVEPKPVKQKEPVMIPLSMRLYSAIQDCQSIEKRNDKFVRGMAHNDVNDAVREACLNNRILPQMEHQFEKTDDGIGVTSYFIVENPDNSFMHEGKIYYDRKPVSTGYAFLKWSSRLAEAQVVGSAISYADKYAMAKGFFLRTSDEDDLDHSSNKLNRKASFSVEILPELARILVCDSFFPLEKPG